MLNISGGGFLWPMDSEVLSLPMATWAFWVLVSFEWNGENNGTAAAAAKSRQSCPTATLSNYSYFSLLPYPLCFLWYFFDSKVPLILRLTSELIIAFLNIFYEMLNE